MIAIPKLPRKVVKDPDEKLVRQRKQRRLLLRYLAKARLDVSFAA